MLWGTQGQGPGGGLLTTGGNTWKVERGIGLRVSGLWGIPTPRAPGQFFCLCWKQHCLLQGENTHSFRPWVGSQCLGSWLSQTRPPKAFLHLRATGDMLELEQFSCSLVPVELPATEAEPGSSRPQLKTIHSPESGLRHHCMSKNGCCQDKRPTSCMFPWPGPPHPLPLPETCLEGQ